MEKKCKQCGEGFVKRKKEGLKRFKERKFCGNKCRGIYGNKDIVGQRFNRLVAIKLSRKNKWKADYWLFKCDCGNEVIRLKSGVTSNTTKSCGCLRKEIDKLATHFKHKMAKTRFYTIWCDVKRRCNNPKNTAYKYYGAKGIKISERWLKFENFKYDMLESYLIHIDKFGEKDTTIDRINNKGNYRRGNTRWATWKEQQRNRTGNRLLTLQGKTQTLAGWSEKTGIQSATIWARIFNYHWSVEKALTTPVLTKN